MFCSLRGAPCRVHSERVEPPGSCGVIFVVCGADCGNNVTERSCDVGKCLSLKGRKHRDASVVAGYVENDPRSYGTAFRIGRRENCRSP